MPDSNMMQSLLASFRDPETARRYGDGPQRFVPGMADLHRMTAVLLAERAPKDARVLVLGAGGGLELRALAQAHPRWTFVGVDPAGAMLDEARRVLGSDAERVTFCEGYIDDAPKGPFDAATCLLTLHFLDSDERTRTARELRRRLKPGAPFVAAHSSFPQGEGRRALWLSRYGAFALASGADPAQVEKMCATVDAHVPLLDPEQDEAILRRAGFADVALFYAAFTWRGWIAHA
ncbi:class I SAM-dependent methyltransferase [Bradyrhizobium sp. CB1650]|uniref:class I SAM-dependent methyltransferase n=1 Tax=Bradyrhizobium sp. CB1650 TaxID=3039153 RepID=UPI002435A975|nr:class I SAM-dependent methyltransferase [Bradyrhizobium sp. CB1650]WGD49687.1 class I SAM-dependent methyltransferase [Bradyrhizobium sp. CB1650]